MAMMKQTLTECIQEAERFIARAKDLQQIDTTNNDAYYFNHKWQASVARASMDLSRALADLRQGR